MRRPQSVANIFSSLYTARMPCTGSASIAMSYTTRCVGWPDPDLFRCRLNGEIDKGGHPYFRGERGKPKPDLLVHVPGTGDNDAVIEVKSSRAKAKEIRIDLATLATLARFMRLGYRRAIYLVYGSDAVLRRIERYSADVDLPIEVWFHPAATAPAACSFTLGRERNSRRESACDGTATILWMYFKRTYFICRSSHVPTCPLPVYRQVALSS